MNIIVQFAPLLRFLVSLFLCCLFRSRCLGNPSLFNRAMTVVVSVFFVASTCSLISEMMGTHLINDWTNGILDIYLYICSFVAVTICIQDVMDEIRKS